MNLSGRLSFHSKLGIKARSLKSRKPFQEQVTGADLFRLSGKWNVLKRIIDRTRDYYFELITDPSSGKVLRYCEEPLSKHLRRGSAKKKASDSNA